MHTSSKEINAGTRANVHFPGHRHLDRNTDGRLPLFHIDLYRLQSPSEILGAGLEEYFYNPPGVTVIEWVERWAVSSIVQPGETASPNPLYRQITIETLSETERRITYEDFGA